MLRKIIRIDRENCNGCGKCATACHEGAIGIVGGKAELLREDYCDGLGDCLPSCPMNAISFEEREAPAYDEAAVLRNKAEKEQKKHGSVITPFPSSCPGTMARKLFPSAPDTSAETVSVPGRLSNFPVQLKLVPTFGPIYDNCDLLVAADCSAYAYGDFHNQFIKGRTTAIGCPKLDQINYAEKLTEILSQNSIRSVKLVRMQVPCCGALERALKQAVEASGKSIPVDTVIISTNGTIVE